MQSNEKAETQKVIRVINKFRVDEQPSDFAYWQTKSPLERLETLESIRQSYIEWKHGTQPRFQRVYTIIKRA